MRAVQHYTPPDGKQFCIYCCFYMSQLNNLDISEAATGTVLSKKLFVKIWNYSQKTNDVGVPFFARLKTWRPATLLKRGSNFSSEDWNFKGTPILKNTSKRLLPFANVLPIFMMFMVNIGWFVKIVLAAFIN